MVKKIIQSVEGLPNRPPLTEISDTTTYDFDDSPELTKLCNENPDETQKAACDLMLQLEKLK